MTAHDTYDIEEDFRRKYPKLDHAKFSSWMQELTAERRTKLISTSAISKDVKEVTRYFLELCAGVFLLEETKAAA